MKKIFVLIVAIALGLSSIAQSDVPRFTKTAIGTTGCYFYSPSTEVEFELSYSEDSAEVWTASTTHGDFGYELICVKFVEPIGDDQDANEEMLESYLDFLQGQFAIVSSTGYGYGHTMESHPYALGMIDYWVDEEGFSWSVKGWIDSSYLAVMFVWGEKEPDYSITSVYLDGFRFP